MTLTEEIKARYYIPPKKKVIKSKWCDGFVVGVALTDIDKVEIERIDRLRNFKHRTLKYRR